MEERASALGGTLTIDSRPGDGTRVRLEVRAVIRVAIADDHAVVRQGLRDVPRAPGRTWRSSARRSTASEAVEAVERTAPDVVLLDLVMPRVDGIEATRRIRARSPATRIIVLTSFADDDTCCRRSAPAPPATCSRTSQPPELAAAIRTVHAGEALLRPDGVVEQLAREDVARRAPPRRRRTPLTAREREVLDRCIARGRANKAIAFELGVSEQTVKTHVRNILGKLGAHRPHAGGAVRGRAGLVDAEP